MTIYQQEGYDSRRDYLNCLADDYGLDVEEVYAIASILGSTEDFDGLVSHCQDRADGCL